MAHTSRKWYSVPLTPSEVPARELIRTKKQNANIDAATAGLAGYLSSRTAWWCDQIGIAPERMDMGTAFADLYEGIEKLYEKKGVTFQEQVQAKQRRYYMRQEQAQNALESKHHRSESNEAEQEAI